MQCFSINTLEEENTHFIWYVVTEWVDNNNLIGVCNSLCYLLLTIIANQLYNFSLKDDYRSNCMLKEGKTTNPWIYCISGKSFLEELEMTDLVLPEYR